MCMEEDFVPEQGGGEYTKVTRYGLGARGIDYMEQSITGGSPTKAYPLYDGHGNMLATISLSRTLANQGHYDAWGAVRAEQDVDSMNPRGQYVANLGHQTDVESSLVYMRARYYDPGTGRFVTEDPARDGANWFVYCGNDPVNRVDADGRFWHLVVGSLLGGFFNAGLQYLLFGSIDLGDVALSMITGAVGAAWVKDLTTALKTTMSMYRAAISMNRVELGRHVYARMAAAVGKKALWVGSHAPFQSERRELNGPIGRVLAANLGNAVAIWNEIIEDTYGF